MSGSGGVFSGGYNPSKYREVIKKTREKTRDIQFETTINGMIADLLSDYHRDVEITTEHLNELKEIIEEEIWGSVELRFGGSVSKRTYVDGLSDVDVLLIIDKSELSNASPQEVLNYVKERIIEENLSTIDEVAVGKLAVTVKFSDGEKIQLLPAIRRYEGFRIPDAEGQSWSNVIRPDKFAEKLSEVNKNCGGKVVPTIKLVKDILSRQQTNQKFTGYHIESLAIEIFKSYPSSVPNTNKALLKYFFEKAKEAVKTPIKEKTNQSIHVDDYMEGENSPERLRASYLFDRIARRMNNADKIGYVEEWESILNE